MIRTFVGALRRQLVEVPVTLAHLFAQARQVGVLSGVGAVLSDQLLGVGVERLDDGLSLVLS